MKTNKEIITKIVSSLDLVVSKKYTTSKITKDKLIECWSSYRSISEHNFYGYATAASLGKIYRKIFVNINKETREPWKAYILRINGYKYCSSCTKLHSITQFNRDKVQASGIGPKCKSCASTLFKKYRENNLEKDAANSAKRRASKTNRTPTWLTEEDIWLIKEFYSLSKLREECTGIKWHVDHMIPLQGKLVSGLHVPQNLQVIPAKENISKSNSFSVG